MGGAKHHSRADSLTIGYPRLDAVMKLFSLFVAILTFFLAVYLKVTGGEWEFLAFMAFLSLMNAVIVGWIDG